MGERIGERLVRLGIMSHAQVARVLQRQAAGDTRLFGEIAIDLGLIPAKNPSGRKSFEQHATRSTGPTAEWVRVLELVSPRDAASRPRRIIDAISNVSAQARIEQASHEALAGAIPDMMFLLDAEGVFLACHAAQAAGSPSTEPLPRQMRAVSPEEVARATLRSLQAVREAGKMHEFRYTVPMNGEVFAFEARMMPAGEGRVCAIVRDVTADVIRRRTLQESLENYREMVEMANSIVLRFDPQGTITYLNPFAEQLFGYASGELVGQPLLGTVVPDAETTGRDLRQLVAELCANPDRFLTNENETVTRDARRVWVRWNNRPIRDAEGRLVGVLSIGMDISERKRMEARLMENEARHQAILTASPAVILLMRSGRFLYANPCALALLGFETPEQISGLPAEELIAPQDLQFVRERVRQCESGKTNALTEISVLHRDGSRRVLASVSVPIHMEDGPAILVMGQDISERKRAEERARLEAERLRSLVEIGQHYGDSVQELLDHTLGKGLTLTRSQYGCIFLYSEERAEITLSTYSRQTKDDCLIRNPFKSHRLDETGLLGEAVRQRRPVLVNDCRTLNPLKKGYPAGHVEISRFLAVPVFSSGRVVAAVWVANKAEPYEETDQLQLSLLMDSAWRMVERRQAEEALLESRRDLNRAQAVAHIGSWRLNLPQGDLLWSEEAYRIAGLPVGTPMTYESFLDTVHPEDREMVIAFRDAVARGEQSGLEYRILAGGVVKWVRVEAEVERDVDWFGTAQDITERKRLEAQFLQAQKMDAVGRLAGGIAHDFNNLLTIIGGNAEMALEGMHPGQAAALELAEIKLAVKRAAELIRKLLAFSRRAIVERRVVDLNAVLSGMEHMLRTLIGEHIELVTRLADDLPAVRIDPSQVEQVLTNLAVNARDAMPDGGRLTLETAAVTLDENCKAAHPDVATGRYVLFCVSDTGCGMSEEVQAHLFEPFFTTKEAGRGTGLGLSTCYGIVKQNGGFIWVYSREGHGTAVKVYLPAVAEAAETGRKESETVLAGGNETILLVEDEAGIRSTVERILSHQGYRVMAAAGGGEALKLVSRLHEPLSLLVTDVVMPGMSGRELAERLIGLYPTLKVLYISGYTDDILAHHGTPEEGVDLLSKPFSAATLASRIREVLDRYNPAITDQAVERTKGSRWSAASSAT